MFNPLFIEVFFLNNLKSHTCYSCECYKLSILSMLSVKMLTPRKCYKFPCSKMFTYVEGGL